MLNLWAREKPLGHLALSSYQMEWNNMQKLIQFTTICNFSYLRPLTMFKLVYDNQILCNTCVCHLQSSLAGRMTVESYEGVSKSFRTGRLA
jgi:hypothetical protein